MQPNNKPTKEMYITRTTKGFWPYTRPFPDRDASRHSAENQVSFALLLEKGIEIDDSCFEFSYWLREFHDDIVEEAQQYIHETCIVKVPEGVSKDEFRKDFCKMMQDSGLLDGEISRDELYDEDEDDLIEYCENDFSDDFREVYS